MSDILGYKGKRVIVSGCFSGMGEATAKMLLDLGAEVHGFDFRESALPLASFNQVDLRNPASIEADVSPTRLARNPPPTRVFAKSNPCLAGGGWNS